MRAFSMMLDRLHPDLRWLAALMGDRAATFIAAHEGREITLQMRIPTRAELFDELCAVTSYLECEEAKPEDRENTIERLATRYGCAPDQIIASARLGKRLLHGAHKESHDGEN
jgi:hypothetical protein